MPRRIATAVACAMFLLAGGRAAALAQTPPADVFDRVKHGYAASEGGVTIHYASLGEGLSWS